MIAALLIYGDGAHWQGQKQSRIASVKVLDNPNQSFSDDCDWCVMRLGFPHSLFSTKDAALETAAHMSWISDCADPSFIPSDGICPVRRE